MLTTSAVLSDPNISSRIDGAGIREGVPVADAWWDGGVDDSLIPDRVAIADALSRSWAGPRDPYYQDPECGL